MNQNARTLLLAIGIVLAAYVLFIAGLHLHQQASAAEPACSGDCQPFYGGAARSGNDLLLIVHHDTSCRPAACNPCGADAGAIRSLDITVLPEGGIPYRTELSGTLHETIVIPGVFSGTSPAGVTVAARYSGYANSSCSHEIVNTQL